MEQTASPEMFDSPFFSLDNGMPAQSAFDPNNHGPAHNQLQVPRQAFMQPFAQQAYSHSYVHPQSRQQQGSYPSSPSWQLHSRQHQHAMPQYGNHYTYGIRHHSFSLSHGPHARTAGETKARLDKKHVEILEHEFSKNQKPSSIIKRELAEQMGHEVARINNWFQNRRAKEKSNKRTAEYAAREASNQGNSSEGTSSRPRSPEHGGDGHAHTAMDNIRRPVMSSATIGGPEPEDDGHEEEQQVYEPTSDDAADVSVEDDIHTNSHSNNSGLMVIVSQDIKQEDTQEQQQFRTPDSDLHEFDYPTLQGFQGLGQNSLNSLEYLDEEEIATAWFHPLPQAPSDYFGSDVAPLSLLNAGAPMAMAEQFSEGGLKVQQLASPVSMCSTSQTTPPPKEMASRFALKSPRPINIAARRNLQRPAPLGLGVSRKTPYCQGPKTGIDIPRRHDDMTAMRRTASATGLRRLQRVSEGLRSPDIQFQGMRSPSYNSSGSPVSPGRSDTPATNNSDEYHGLPYGNFNAPLTSRFEHSINTPPVTPGLPLGYSTFANPFEQAWARASNEQSLATPSLCSHGGSEMDFPGTSHMPNYIASQPATPGFPRPDTFGPGFRFAAAHGGMANAPEYTFPDSSYVDSSPEQSMSKTFQFAENVTPQSFNTHE